MKMRPWVIALRFTACVLLLLHIVAKDQSLLLSLGCCCRIFTARKNMLHLGKALFCDSLQSFEQGCPTPFVIQPADLEKRRTAEGLEIWKVGREGNRMGNKDKYSFERAAGVRYGVLGKEEEGEEGAEWRRCSPRAAPVPRQPLTRAASTSPSCGQGTTAAGLLEGPPAWIAPSNHLLNCCYCQSQ